MNLKERLKERLGELKKEIREYPHIWFMLIAWLFFIFLFVREFSLMERVNKTSWISEDPLSFYGFVICFIGVALNSESVSRLRKKIKELEGDKK